MSKLKVKPASKSKVKSKSKSKAAPKSRRKTIWVLSIALLVMIVFSAVLFFIYHPRPGIEDREIVRDLIIKDIIDNQNTDKVTITFEKPDITRIKANVEIMLNYGPEFPESCVSYNYELSKLHGTWEIVSSEQTIVC